ncbi:MAG: hypothetical protein KGV59_04680, partial [Tenacibaculum sp.]|nr:hypothetical protein [Tenacibaculum sp.]
MKKTLLFVLLNLLVVLYAYSGNLSGKENFLEKVNTDRSILNIKSNFYINSLTNDYHSVTPPKTSASEAKKTITLCIGDVLTEQDLLDAIGGASSGGVWYAIFELYGEDSLRVDSFPLLVSETGFSDSISSNYFRDISKLRGFEYVNGGKSIRINVVVKQENHVNVLSGAEGVDLKKIVPNKDGNVKYYFARYNYTDGGRAVFESLEELDNTIVKYPQDIYLNWSYTPVLEYIIEQGGSSNNCSKLVVYLFPEARSYRDEGKFEITEGFIAEDPDPNSSSCSISISEIESPFIGYNLLTYNSDYNELNPSLLIANNDNITKIVTYSSGGGVNYRIPEDMIKHQWQKSTDNSVWEDIPNAIKKHFSSSAELYTGTTFFRRKDFITGGFTRDSYEYNLNLYDYVIYTNAIEIKKHEKCDNTSAIKLNKTAPATPVGLGDEITYTFTVENVGDVE